MKSSDVYTQNQIDKLGNTLILLCEKIRPITKTHLLKLIFIIEEISINKFGIPFFDLRFDVWKLGPVSRDLFVELSDEPNLLAEYITKDVKGDRTYIVPKKSFSDDEFSDIEMDLLNQIIERFQDCTANELINHTHKKDSLWYKTAKRHGILEQLEKGQLNTTDIEIDMQEIVEDNESKLALYKSHKEFLNQSKSLKL